MISNFNQGDIFQIISPHSDEKICSKCSQEEFTSVWNGLTCWLSKDVFRQCWIVNAVTKPWTVANFGKTFPLTIFFFLKMFKIWWRFHKWNKKRRKCFLFLRWLDLNRERQILTIRNRILVTGSPCVHKQHSDFKLQSRRYFPNHFSSLWWENKVKVLSWRFY